MASPATPVSGAGHRPRMLGDRPLGTIGLGCMPLSTAGAPSVEQGIRTIHAALDAGVRLLDTADAYAIDEAHVGDNERLIARALRGRADGAVVATKGGHVRRGTDWALDGSPAHLRRACEASLRALEREAIDLYQLHRPDPKVPYAESVGALRDLLDEGVIQMAGISNADVAQIDEANEVLGGRLVSVQNQFSPAFRSSLGELEHCARLGIAFLPWSPLGGISNAAELGSRHAAFQRVADAHGVSVQQVALAWQLALAPVVIPIPGASRPQSITDSARAADLRLSAEQVAELSEA